MSMNEQVEPRLYETDRPRRFDGTGKCSLDHIYNRPDPRSYYSTLMALDYMIPQAAKPVFCKVLAACRETRAGSLKVVDLGCSYGINAALLGCGMDMGRLYALYAAPGVARLDRRALLARDREIFAARRGAGSLTFVGVDAAPRAVAYARDAGLIDEKISLNLERRRPTARCRSVLDGADVVISTGCVGYITDKTIARVVDAAGARPPWMAHYVLRMFSFEPIQEMLAERGYVTASGPRPVRQRRFASREEQEHVLDRLVDMGIDPSGYETEGWYYADLYISRPADEVDLVPSWELVRT